MTILTFVETKMSKAMILFLIVSVANGLENDQFETFIRDMIKEWKLLSPTIIFQDEMPELCLKLKWGLCLTNIMDTDELVEHIATIHQLRKQDGIIFVHSPDTKDLIRKLAKHVPSLFSSECPVFIPTEYDEDIDLRLDSNIIFYKEETMHAYTLADKFAVKGGPKIVLSLGNWNVKEGVTLQQSMNRWDRRIDLKGATFKNCLAENGNWAEFIKDKDGNITGSKGYFQDMLFYITDRLNLTFATVEAQWNVDLLENGSWTGIIGMIQRKEIDVISSGLGINSQYSSVIDLPIATDRQPVTLIAARPKGTALSMWAYVRVFGVYQWIIFTMMLMLLGIALTLPHIFSKVDTHIAFGTKRGANMDNQLNSVYSNFALVFLYAIQMGSHTNSAMWSARGLTLTTSVLTLLMFVYYTTEITAEMTSGPSKVPIKTFDDVIHGNYKVITISDYSMRILQSAEPGSSKNMAYNSNFKNIETKDRTILASVYNELISDPKSLLYDIPSSIMVNQVEELLDELKKQLFALRMDDAVYGSGTLGLQANSEFLQMFNHYIMKNIETGCLKRLYLKYHSDFFTRENYEMVEPQPLGFNNLMFCFIFLAIAVCLSIVVAILELLLNKCARIELWASRKEDQEKGKKRDMATIN